MQKEEKVRIEERVEKVVRDGQKKEKKVLKHMLKKYFNRKKFKEQKMRNKLFRLCITVGVFSTFNFTLIQFII